MTNEEMRLSNVVSAQLEALHHWRKQADLDYMKLKRLYWALVEARDFIKLEGINSVLLQKLDTVIANVVVSPPKEFKK